MLSPINFPSSSSSILLAYPWLVSRSIFLRAIFVSPTPCTTNSTSEPECRSTIFSCLAIFASPSRPVVAVIVVVPVYSTNIKFCLYRLTFPPCMSVCLSIRSGGNYFLFPTPATNFFNFHSLSFHPSLSIHPSFSLSSEYGICKFESVVKLPLIKELPT